MPPPQYFYRPTNLAYHDLTLAHRPPDNLKSLLGLGLKFIPTPSHTTRWNMLTRDGSTFPRLDRSLRLKTFFADKAVDDDNPDYNPRMYVNSDWNPPPQFHPHTLAKRFETFQASLKRPFRKRSIVHNLHPHQRHALEFLQAQKLFLVVHCDKNLGPAIIERDRYIQFVYRDHLNDPLTYKYLTPDETDIAKHTLRNKFDLWFADFYKVLTKGERKFLKRHPTTCTDPFPYFYLTIKVHKIPVKTRPIVSCSGSLLYGVGIWIDDKLQEVAKAQQSYFKSSYDLKQELVSLNLPPNARLFTVDPISMYTNIPADIALHWIATYLRRTHTMEFPGIPVKALVAALRLVMTNRYFHFGDTTWHQQSGTAMGTPLAPPFATIYYDIHEETFLDDFVANMPYYCRFQ
jgi:hypothetical protein